MRAYLIVGLPDGELGLLGNNFKSPAGTVVNVSHDKVLILYPDISVASAKAEFPR